MSIIKYQLTEKNITSMKNIENLSQPGPGKSNKTSIAIKLL